MEQVFTYITWFLLLLARVAAMVGASPLMGSRNVPLQLKAGLIAVLAVLLFPVLRIPSAPLPASFLGYALLVMREVAAGFLFGFCITAVFAIFQLMGQFIDLPIGFSMVAMFDPTSQMQMPIVGHFMYLLALMIFLLLDGHHELLLALGKSLELIPLGGAKFGGGLLNWGLEVFTQMFVLSFQLSLPVVGTLFLTDLAFAILARTVPQMNIFIVGYPAKIVIGLGVLALALPLYGGAMADLFNQRGWLMEQLGKLLLNLR